MVEPETGILERKNIAEIFHKKFVDVMWQKFKLSSHPGYCLVKFVPLFSLGGFSYKPEETIYLNDILDNPLEIRNETYHETAHFLDPFNRDSYKRKIEPTSGDRLLHETLANLATMIYLDLSEGNESAKSFPSYNGKPTYSGLLALDLFEGKKDILLEVAPLNLRKSRRLILPYLRRPLDTSKSPYDQD